MLSPCENVDTLFQKQIPPSNQICSGRQSGVLNDNLPADPQRTPFVL